MIEIVQRVKPAVSRTEDLSRFNTVLPAYQRNTVTRVNLGKNHAPGNPVRQTPVAAPVQPVVRPQVPVQPVYQAPVPQPVAPVVRPMVIPELLCCVRKGQKTALPLMPGRMRLKVCFGWNVKDSRCDVDASAFPLNGTGRVNGDEWFVFYGNPQSPDGSIRTAGSGTPDCQVIEVDLDRLDPSVQRIAFVLTINEAFENKLHFGMLADVYVRVLEYDSGRELISFRPEELFSSITSMTIAELYLHNGQWKLNPVGNGVNKDLAGQCAVYGVDIG